MCFISILLELNIVAVFARVTTTHAVSLDKGGREIFGRDSQLSPKLIRNQWIFTERQGNVRFEVFLLNTGRIKYYFNKNWTYEFFLRFVRTTGSGPRGKTKIIVRTEIWPICEKRKKKKKHSRSSLTVHDTVKILSWDHIYQEILAPWLFRGLNGLLRGLSSCLLSSGGS